MDHDVLHRPDASDVQGRHQSARPRQRQLSQQRLYLGSPQFPVQWEPQFSLNFDYELENRLELEWNIGGAWIVDETGARDYQGVFEWSIQRELIKNVDGFLHGYLIVPEDTRFKERAVFGGGAIWYVSNMIALDASYSFAIKPGSPDPIVRLGLSLAL